MKEELGLDHFHHHAAMVMLAYGFLLLERERVRGERERAGGRRVPRKKGSLTGH
jgi:SRSO17 transposase